MPDQPRAWRWRSVDEQADDQVPWWMVVGPGASGAAHSAVTFLVRMRQSQSRREWGFRPLEEVHDHVLKRRGVSMEKGADVLRRLAEDGVVTTSDGKWAATEMAEEAITVAYAERHPLH